MQLHPEIQSVIDAAPARNLADGTVEQARAGHAAGAAARPPGPEMAEVEEVSVGGRPARRYVPHGATGAGLVFFHGGGWVVGSRDTHDGPCRYLAERSGATVLSVEYRLAPEHRFPAAFDDAVAAVREVLGGSDSAVDPTRVAVGGDSAGGNLAAAAALELRDAPAGAPVRAQLLIYPAVDASMASDSHAAFAAGPFLTAKDMRWFYDLYACDADPTDWRLSPLAADDLSGLPSTLVITAENDVLRDEGEAFAHALAEAGGDATAVRHAGATHGFFGWYHAAAPSRAAVELAGAWLRSKLG